MMPVSQPDAGAMTIRIVQADYGNREQAAAIVALLDAYARDPMGGGKPLPAAVRSALVPGLAGIPGALTLLAHDVSLGFVGLLNAFDGFSTFRARPLLNIHDLFVAPAARGRGIGRALLLGAEDRARARGCCKLTLEVLSGNHGARALYAALGYGAYALDPAAGDARFWQKPLDD